MESVNTWFENGCGYWPGVELYATTKGAKPTLLRNLRKKESAENLQKLKYELEPFRNVPGPVPKPTPIPKKEKSTVTKALMPVEHNPVLFHSLPKELRPVLLEANACHREACMLKAELNDVPAAAEPEALRLQLKIFALLKKNSLCWERIDHWERHGKILVDEKPTFQKLSGGLQAKRQALLFSSISKLRKRLEANVAMLANTTDLKQRTRLEKNVAKQSGNLLKQETQLAELTALIDNTDE